MQVDILIFIILLIGILSGMKNGIFVEIISVFGFAINIMMTKIYTPVVLRFLKRSEITFTNNYVITYVVTFITVYLVMSMVLLFVKKAFMGAVAGFVKGLIISLVILLVYTYAIKLVPSFEKYSRNSIAITIFYEILPNFENFIPDILLEDFNRNATTKIIEKNINTLL